MTINCASAAFSKSARSVALTAFEVLESIPPTAETMAFASSPSLTRKNAPFESAVLSLSALSAIQLSFSSMKILAESMGASITTPSCASKTTTVSEASLDPFPSLALMINSYVLSLPASAGDSKSGISRKASVVVDSSNKLESAPPSDNVN